MSSPFINPGDRIFGSVPKDFCATNVQTNSGSSNSVPRMIQASITQARAAWTDDVVARMQAISTEAAVQQSLDWLVAAPYDGRGNNQLHPDQGISGAFFNRVARPLDSNALLYGPTMTNPRAISNALCNGNGVSVLSSAGLSDMVWAWGQFLDHDITRTDTQLDGGATPAETAPITVPIDDPNYANFVIPFTRSKYATTDVSSGDRRQRNELSSFIDCQNVYGNSAERAYALRALDGTGMLRTSFSQSADMEILPPKNVTGTLDNATIAGNGIPATEYFVCGDVRANEQVLLTAMHTLFIREHNYQCTRIVAETPSLAGMDEVIYQMARRIVTGIVQHITYNEFLPALLGPAVASDIVAAAANYSELADSTLRTEFSTVAYRIGHTMISESLALGPTSAAIEPLPLRNAFFTPTYVTANGVDALLVGATRQCAQEIDSVLVESLRTFLFGPPTANMMHDLASMNIQRGRDHGILRYNDLRVAYGLPRVSSFGELPMPPSVRTAMQSIYASVDDIDPWIGGISEIHAATAGAQVGPLFLAIIREQFIRLRKGDRFFYTVHPALSAEDRAYIESTIMSDVLRRNIKTATNRNAIANLADAFHCSGGSL